MSNEIEKSQATKIRAYLETENVKKQIQRALPNMLNPERFLRVAMTAITKNPKIADCDLTTLMSCLLDCATLGIEADDRRAHLVPYGKKCTLIISYKGLVELVMRTKKVSLIHADVICENDIFEYNMGEVQKHIIDFKQDRGKPYAVYVFAQMKDGSKKYEVMTAEEVEKIRMSSMGKNGKPWLDHWSEMAKKTCFRRLCKWLPLSSEQIQLVSKDDDQFTRPNIDIELPGEEIIESE